MNPGKAVHCHDCSRQVATACIRIDHACVGCACEARSLTGHANAAGAIHDHGLSVHSVRLPLRVATFAAAGQYRADITRWALGSRLTSAPETLGGRRANYGEETMTIPQRSGAFRAAVFIALALVRRVWP